MGEFHKNIIGSNFKKRSFYCRTTIVTQQQTIHILGQQFTNVCLFLPILSNFNLCVGMFVCILFITLILLHCTQRILFEDPTEGIQERFIDEQTI